MLPSAGACLADMVSDLPPLPCCLCQSSCNICNDCGTAPKLKAHASSSLQRLLHHINLLDNMYDDEVFAHVCLQQVSRFLHLFCPAQSLHVL